MNVHQAMRLVFVISLVLGASGLSAQSITVISSGEEVQRCVLAAGIASKMQIASRDDLDNCTFAIEHGALKRRDLAATYNNRGIIKATLERYQEAFEDYGRAIRTMPELPEPYVGRGNVYFLADKLDRAIRDYTKAMDLKLGEMHVAFLNRGMAYEAQGRLEKAESDYRKALELDPDWPPAQQKLDRVLAKRRTVN